MSYSLTLTHAVAVTVFVADKIRRGMFDFVPTREIAHQLDIKPPTLVKILQSLIRAGIVESREGAKGGIRMAKPAEEVRILHIFEAMENQRPVFQTDLSFRVTGEIPDRAKLAIRSVFDEASQALRRSLDARTIADLLIRLDR
ncbi:MAG: Rrf2 family transcriptional regulator [Fibrobacteria bacterium]|nr:Rrf2 family transcriptional regulator [Fibrobacteria bacterium]